MQAEWYKGIFLLMTFLLIKYGWMHPYWHERRCDIHNDRLRKKVQERHLYLLFLYIIKEDMSLKEICSYVILSSVLLHIIGKTYLYIILSVIHSVLRKAEMSPNPVWYMSPKERKDAPTGIDDTYVPALSDGFYDAFCHMFCSHQHWEVRSLRE